MRYNSRVRKNCNLQYSSNNTQNNSAHIGLCAKIRWEWLWEGGFQFMKCVTIRRLSKRSGFRSTRLSINTILDM